MNKEEIRDLLRKFCELMLKKEEEVQFVRIKIGMKDKSNVKFKQFRKYEN